MAAAMGIAAVEATNALAAAKAGELGTAGAAENTLVLAAKGEVVNAAVPVAVMGGSSAGDELTVGATTAASRLNVGDVIAATMGQGPQSLRYLDHDPRPLEDVMVERQLIAMGFGPDRYTYDEPDFNTRITQLQKELFGIEAVSDTTASAPSLSAGDVVGLEDSWIKLAIKAGLSDASHAQAANTQSYAQRA